MASSGKRNPFSLAAAFFFPIIFYGILLSIFLLRPSPDLSDAKKPRLSRPEETASIGDITEALFSHGNLSDAEQLPLPRPLSPGEIASVAMITKALLSRGNYSAMIPDVVSELIRHYSARAAPVFTIFVPSDAAEINHGRRLRPEVQIVMARVDRESFGPAGGLSHGSTLPTRAGRAIWVTESAEPMRDPKAEVTDWSLYDNGVVVVHGMSGALYRSPQVAAVGRFAISGLIVQRRFGISKRLRYRGGSKRECIRRLPAFHKSGSF